MRILFSALLFVFAVCTTFLENKRCEALSLRTTIKSSSERSVSEERFNSLQDNIGGGKGEGQSTEHWVIAPTLCKPESRPLTPELKECMLNNEHPIELQDELGNGVFITDDWRRVYYTYEREGLIDPDTGYAKYEAEIEGVLPDDLVGTLYRNGPGKFGINGERVAHALDGDGLIFQIKIYPKSDNGKRKVVCQSRFVETAGFQADVEAQSFTQRSTFGTCIRGLPQLFPGEGKGVNSDPSPQPILSKVFGNAFNTDIKNTANTQVIAFGGKVLALFEAGLPYEIDPQTLKTIGEYDMNGSLAIGKLPVKISNLPESMVPDMLGGAAHTAHPNVCPRTGHLVGWTWSQLPVEKALEVVITEWNSKDFEKVDERKYILDQCELAPHDMAMTDNAVLLKVNALSMNSVDFLSGIKAPSAALEMDGRAPVRLHVLPRPCAEKVFEPFSVEVPACFSIHFSHSYEDPDTGNIIAHFSGWPPSDSKDFLGAWGGFAPVFDKIPPTYIWRLEIDTTSKKTVHLDIARGARNCCAEHPLVHPNFNTRRAQNLYAVASNLNGDSTAPCGYVRLNVETGSTTPLDHLERNTDIDSYFFGTRYFAGEPLIVPKKDADLSNENEGYLLGMVNDVVADKSFLAIFDLERDIKLGPVAKIWMKSQVPFGLHGCFDSDQNESSSTFC